MVYITGDTHANFHKFTVKNFPIQKQLTREDTVIICGDFGGIWSDTKEERYWLTWLGKRSFTICFVDGNHENFDRLSTFEVVDFHGGKAHKIGDNIYHLMRGYIFDFEGKKFFAFGGASSHDIRDGILNPGDYASKEEFMKAYSNWSNSGRMFRVNHISWWKEELPSREEMENGIESLQKCDWKVDYVISHCLPQEVCSCIGFRGADTLTKYFNQLLRNKIEFKEWHVGHYHFDDRVYGRYFVHYHDIVRIL